MPSTVSEELDCASDASIAGDDSASTSSRLAENPVLLPPVDVSVAPRYLDKIY